MTPFDFPIVRYPHDPLLERIWELRPNFTRLRRPLFALAEALEATLVTRDAALATAGTHRARVELI
jgi:predicted nucleic acid-binding protein